MSASDYADGTMNNGGCEEGTEAARDEGEYALLTPESRSA